MRTDNVDAGALMILLNVKPWLTKQQYKTIRGKSFPATPMRP